jgi:hypothetical protein
MAMTVIWKPPLQSTSVQSDTCGGDNNGNQEKERHYLATVPKLASMRHLINPPHRNAKSFQLLEKSGLVRVHGIEVQPNLTARPAS